MQFKCCYTEHFPVSSGHFLPSLKQNMFCFFFFYTNWPQMFVAPFIGSQWVKTVYMKQTIDTTQLKPSMLVVMNSTSNNPNVTFNHIQHEHA